MRVALCGDDRRALPLLESLLSDPRFSLAFGLTSPPLLEELERRAPTADLSNLRTSRGSSRNRDASTSSLPATLSRPASAEESLPWDVLLITGTDARVLSIAEEWAATAPLAFVWPAAGQTTAFAYALALLQADRPVRCVPLFAWRKHAHMRRLRDLLQRGAFGVVQAVQLERRLARPLAELAVTEAEAAEAFLEDVDLLRYALGNVTQLTAIRAPAARGGIALQNVTLQLQQGPQALWSIAAVPEEKDLWQLTVTGEGARAVLRGEAQSRTLELEIQGIPGEASAGPCALPTEVWTRECLEHALQGKSLEPDWTDYLRAMEAVEAIERSVRRRRTLDLDFEAPSERSQFKTQMTAAGCSLLMCLLPAVVLYLIVVRVFPFSDELKRWLIALIFLPLGLFLALQAFYFFTRPARGAASKQ